MRACGAWSSGSGGVRIAACTDASASTTPGRPASGERTACSSSSARSSAADSRGLADAISAATPATWGAAIDVPERVS